jgi:ATP-binding cassette, subfamily B, multidrug efflux pump
MLTLFRFLKPYRWAVAGVVACVFLQCIAELALPNLMARIVNIGIIQGRIGYIVRIGAVMLAIAALGMLAAMLASRLSALSSMGFGRDVRAGLFRHVQSFSLHEFDTFGTSSLITRNTNDITQVQMVLMVMLRLMVQAPLMCVGGIIMALSKDVTLSLVIIAIMPVIAAVIALISRSGMPLFKGMQAKIDRMNQVLRENLSGMRVIRAFNRGQHEQERFDAANRDLTATALRVFKIMAGMMPAMLLLMNITVIAIIWFGAQRVDLGRLQVGDTMAFLQYTMQILFSLLMASMMFVMIPRAQVSAARINAVLATAPTIRDLGEQAGACSQQGWLEFRDVSFRYQGAEEPALDRVSFKAAPGELTAIIGSTGAGKTTLINLIPRFYDVDSGVILIDGCDIRRLTQHELRVKIGIVPQATVLFSGSIAANIKFGKPDATPDEVRHAAAVAQALEFIDADPAGFDKAVSQGGTNFSGGQRQRLAIARALLPKPEIYLFDDSFSALDFKTDATLRAALQAETAEATVLLVGQRVATIMHADRIVVLDEGKVAGIGRHAELLASCPVYREIVYSQLSEEELA